MAVSSEQLREFIAIEMRGSDIKLVIEKVVYESDTLKAFNRFIMPINQLSNNDFLKPHEIHILTNTKESNRGIDVSLLGPTLKMYEKPMRLKMWRMGNSVNYVFATAWHAFWAENEQYLKKESKIQIWSFRVDGQLCFAVCPVH
ncbi:hypothetical protein SSX86_000660 [Deinandra increscens subsp. villosa]|uniref:TF-B3 domain-containing protein n=1 Tax=Deinandra increscens subsp. villosa TaxID=3103831 RepID=A0AAP0HBR4_9ASTR